MPTLVLPNTVVYSLLGVKMTDEDFYKKGYYNTYINKEKTTYKTTTT